MNIRKLFVLFLLISLLTASACSDKKDTSDSSAPGGIDIVAEDGKKYLLDRTTYKLIPIDPKKHSEKVVLLTFDDGPRDSAVNESLLSTLDKHNAKAIFFMNGVHVESNPGLVKLVHDRGQMIGNHSWEHLDLTHESEASVALQIDKVQTAVKNITGVAPVFIRPPYLAINDLVVQEAEKAGAVVMSASIDPRDWEMTPENNNPDEIVRRVMDVLHPGGNILMHEYPWTAEALDNLLTKLKEQGYSFVDPYSIRVP
ncbi:polysaccharide deacetylase family protein [Paenibacillus sp. GCM10027627]|uniref:polysaccharide deacetylase family protein n=1 Tax=unclassified Paenibacillus TaxID=185978 RepID=UPI00363B476C